MDEQIRNLAPGEFRVLEYQAPDFVGDWTQVDYGDPDAPRRLTFREQQ